MATTPYPGVSCAGGTPGDAINNAAFLTANLDGPNLLWNLYNQKIILNGSASVFTLPSGPAVITPNNVLIAVQQQCTFVPLAPLFASLQSTALRCALQGLTPTATATAMQTIVTNFVTPIPST